MLGATLVRLDSQEHKVLLDCVAKLEFLALVHQVQSVLLAREEMLDYLVHQA